MMTWKVVPPLRQRHSVKNDTCWWWALAQWALWLPFFCDSMALGLAYMRSALILVKRMDGVGDRLILR
jgi:hypothetical protein